MLYENKIWVGTGKEPACLLPQMANRHGLIAGATGTGKTVSLKVLAEGFFASLGYAISGIGFAADESFLHFHKAVILQALQVAGQVEFFRGA